MTKSVSLFLCLISCFPIFSQLGPGGVGTTDGTSSLKIWYLSSTGVSTTGGLINSIQNRAGIAALDISEAGTQRPTLVTNAVNGFPEISFSGSNRLRTGLTLTTTNFVTNQASSFIVVRADNSTQRSSVYTTDPLVGSTRFSNHIPWGGNVYYDIGTCCGTTARIQINSVAGLNNYSFWSYDAHPTTGKQLYRNGSLLQNRAGSSSYTSHANHRFNLGANTSGTSGFVGDVTEVIIFNAKINSAQRIIVENYLAAKYGLSSSDNDIYDEDNAVNGDFDFDVAGIGRIDASNVHNDAQGTGIVRVLNPSALDDDEFLLWGHDGTDLTNTTTTDIPSQVASRIERIWRVSEADTSGNPVDVGNVDLRFDLSGFGSIDPSILWLLVDTDGDGNFSDESPITNITSLGGDVYAFEQISALTNNSQFTLAFGKQKIITNRKITYRIHKD